jgi:DNA-binding CsgD family transcriptional regulator
MARPKFLATEEQQRTAKSLAAFGMNQEAIARMLGCSPKTLRKHFSKDLELGDIEAVAQVAQAHYKMAKSGTDSRATVHFLEKRQRWLNVQSSERRLAAIPDFVVMQDKEAA